VIGLSLTRPPTQLLCAVLVLSLLPLFLQGCATHTVSAKKSRAAAPKKHPARKPGGYYRVRKGDSLYSIAWRAGLDYHTLARWNGLKSPYTIYPGQKIRLSPPKIHNKPAPVKRDAGQKPHPQEKAGKPAGTKPVVKPASRPPLAAQTHKKPPKNVTAGSLHWRWPARGRILSRFASNDAAKGGIRIGGRRGQKIVAAESGQVVYVGSGLIGYGQLIIIKHNNKYLSAYGHNSKLRVKEGDRVSRGQHISDMGVTHQGTPLLYFEIRRYGKPVDPLKYLPH